MRGTEVRRKSAVGRQALVLLSAGLLLAACVSTTASATPTLAPGQTPKLAPGATPTLPGGPGSTLPPGVPPPPTDASVTPPTGGATDPPTGPPTPTYTTTEAASHVGELARVCGVVVSANFVPAEPGLPTFLNVDQPWPFITFNILIWGDERQAFDTPPDERFLNKNVCVRGTIEAYGGWYQIEAGRPDIKINN